MASKSSYSSIESLVFSDNKKAHASAQPVMVLAAVIAVALVIWVVVGDRDSFLDFLLWVRLLPRPRVECRRTTPHPMVHQAQEHRGVAAISIILLFIPVSCLFIPLDVPLYLSAGYMYVIAL